MPNNQSPTAVIFDLDGTLIDSEPNYYEADRILMAEHGIDFTPEMKRPFVGQGNEEMMRVLKTRYTLDVTVEALLARKNALYMQIARQNTQAFGEMAQLVKTLAERNIPLAVASGSSPAIIRELTKKTGLADYFRVFVSSEDVPHPKPEPDVFFEAARKLGVEPTGCVVVEDALYGVQAALKAGMRVIAVPTFPGPGLAVDFHKATWLVEGGMADFRADEALAWLSLSDRQGV